MKIDNILLCLILLLIFILYFQFRKLNALYIKIAKSDILKNKNIHKNEIGAIIIILFIIIFLLPYFFTRSIFNEYNFSSTGAIGDTLGGITSPFINGLSAILVYIAFKEQKRSNDILINQIDFQKIKDEENLIKIKDLVLYDLEIRIKPILIYLQKEIPISVSQIESKEIKYYKDYVDLNDILFKSNDMNNYVKIFSKLNTDFSTVITIYNRVNFIYKHTPLQISYKYPRDPNSLVYIGYSRKKRKRTIKRHKEKTLIELDKLLENINSLLILIDDIVLRYQNKSSVDLKLDDLDF